MAYSVTATMSKEQAKTQGIYPVDMYVLNASLSGTDYLYYINLNQNTVGYSLNATGDVSSGTVLYTAAPVGREQLKSNIQGEIDGVSISLPNVNREMETLVQNYNYLRGRELYIVSMFAKNMPANNGTDAANYIGVATDSDYRSYLKEKYYIDSASSNEEVVTFVCKSKFDIRNIVLPGRIFTPECQWALRGDYMASECDPGNNINATTYPTCDGTLNQCAIRNNLSRFGGFPSIPRLG